MEIDGDIFSDDYKNIYEKREIYLLQFPNGKLSSYSVGIINKINNLDINHTASTECGSSGSPILNLLNLKIIAIYKGKTLFEYNEGTFLKLAIERFNEKYLNDLNDNNKLNNNKS